MVITNIASFSNFAPNKFLPRTHYMAVCSHSNMLIPIIQEEDISNQHSSSKWRRINRFLKDHFVLGKKATYNLIRFFLTCKLSKRWYGAWTHKGLWEKKCMNIPGRNLSVGEVLITCNKQVGISMNPWRKRSTFSRVLGWTGVMTYIKSLNVSMPLTIPGS